MEGLQKLVQSNALRWNSMILELVLQICDDCCVDGLCVKGFNSSGTLCEGFCCSGI